MYEQGEALRVQFGERRRKRVKPLKKAGFEIQKAWAHHWGAAMEHSAYVGAVARRSGLRIWAGRGLLAALLVRFRLTAFTSEVGESLRPLVPPWQVTAAYAVSWAYVSLDVLLRACDEYAFRGPTWRVVRTLLFFGLFHTVATMLLPALIIHEAVHRSEVALKHLSRRAATAEWPRLAALLPRLWIAPTLIGLLLIPLCPLLDAPLEKLVELLFKQLWPLPKKKRKLAVLTDYEAATADDVPVVNRDGALSDAPHPPPQVRPPERHEEPELVRAAGRGEPAYAPSSSEQGEGEQPRRPRKGSSEPADATQPAGAAAGGA